MKTSKTNPNCTIIPSNKTYLWFLGLLSLVIGVSGIFYSVFSPDVDFRALYFTGSVLLIACSALSFAFSSFKVLLYEDKITLRNFKTYSFDIFQIEYIDWTWYEQRQGSCYIGLKDGRSYGLLRKLYSKRLYDILSEYAKQNSIPQRGIN